MRHYSHYGEDGYVHVESVLNGKRWQHHVHTVPEFVRWCAFVSEKSLVRHWARESGLLVLVQPEMEKRRSPLVSIPPFGRGFSRHGVYRPMTFFRQRAAREKDIPRC